MLVVCYTMHVNNEFNIRIEAEQESEWWSFGKSESQGIVKNIRVNRYTVNGVSAEIQQIHGSQSERSELTDTQQLRVSAES